ncbi:MAG: hypothetical protein WAV95_13405 [Azonexus sp.]
MKIAFRPVLLALLIPCGSACGADGEKIGRLFFTPEQRAALDRQAAGQTGATGNDLTIDGEIWRSKQRRARWINGQNTLDAPAEAPALPIGERYSPGTGKRDSLLGDGQLVIRPGTPVK